MALLGLDNNFEQRKSKTLKGLQFDSTTTSPDKSPKGFIDEAIIALIACINKTNAFYTTSSCSGRIALFLQEKAINTHHLQSQKGGDWLLISHEFIKNDQITNSIQVYRNKLDEAQRDNNNNNNNNNKRIEISLKFEAFILHIECRDLMSAKQLLSLSREIGLRESGINAISNRIILRITFNLKMEVPLFYGDKNQLIVENKTDSYHVLPNINSNYIAMLTNIANDKMRENLSKIDIFYQAFKSKFLSSFKWYTAYQSRPHLLSKKTSSKMDLLFKNIDTVKQKIATIKHSEILSIIQDRNDTENEKGKWCLLVNNKYLKTVHDKLINLKLIDKQKSNIIAHQSPKYNRNWSYIPIKYEFACNIMNKVASPNKNKLRYWYDLYDNTLSTHSKIYSFDIDLLLQCINVIPYYSQWLNILNDESKNNEEYTECVIIGLCFRFLPKISASNIRCMLESKIYSRSNSKQWCSALISILGILYDAIKLKQDAIDATDDSNDELMNINLNKIINDFPTKYEKLGDCVLFPSCFESTLKCIRSILPTSNIKEFYDVICQYFKCDQIGLQQAIQKGIKRESGVKILYDPKNKNGMVTHKENKIWYHFNVRKVMFSSGNLTEKIRMGQIAKSTDIVLDLYAGIGYFTLSFLIHAKVQFVYCCEINPNSIKSLKSNMRLNKIDDNRYEILEGDNNKTTLNLINKVDRVNLGLLPSSEQGWNPAIRALKSIGGTLHIHHNVHIDHKQEFVNNMVHRLQQIIQQYNDKKHWNIQILHCEHVKWYAPKISHMVVDVKLS